jgi:metal-responsive CopG/Arc/MetJ family transcriptional regulator
MNGTKLRRRKMAAATVAVKKVVADFPAPLFHEAEQAARELSMNRSSFIRCAVETFLRNRQKEKLEKAIAESFLANAGLEVQLMDEFKHTDSEERLTL